MATRTVSSSFARMIVFSLLAHALFSTAFILTHQGRHGDGPVEYIDLDMTQPASAPAAKIQAPVEPPSPMEEPSPDAPTTQPLPAEPSAAHAEPQAATAPPQNFQQGSLGFGIVNGHFGSISDGRTLRDDMREYYLEMLAKFNETWWKTRTAEGATGRGASFLVVVSRDGNIVDANLLQSSGNPSYDRVMLQALKSAGPLGPLPQTYEGPFFSAPLRFVAPLNLMNPFAG